MIGEGVENVLDGRRHARAHDDHGAETCCGEGAGGERTAAGRRHLGPRSRPERVRQGWPGSRDEADRGPRRERDAISGQDIHVIDELAPRQLVCQGRQAKGGLRMIGGRRQWPDLGTQQGLDDGGLEEGVSRSRAGQADALGQARQQFEQRHGSDVGKTAAGRDSLGDLPTQSPCHGGRVHDESHRGEGIGRLRLPDEITGGALERRVVGDVNPPHVPHGRHVSGCP